MTQRAAEGMVRFMKTLGMRHGQSSSPVMIRVGTVSFRMPSSRSKTDGRSEEHTSELQSLMRISYAVFCLKKKTHTRPNTYYVHPLDVNNHSNQRQHI